MMKKFFLKLKKSTNKRLYEIDRLVEKAAEKIRRFRFKIFGYLKINGLRLPFYEITEASRLQLLNGTYEDVERIFVRKYICAGVFVVELGASIGVVSCYILQKNPSKLLSFEAVPRWAIIARKTVGLNFKKAPFELVQMAIAGVGQSEVAFEYNDQENLGGLVVTSLGSSGVNVSALSLFDVNSRYGIPFNAWLVMDIEGMEWDIAKNQGAALMRYEGIIVECHQTTDGEINITPTRIVEVIILCGFTLIEKADHGTHIVAVFKRAIK